VRELPRRAATWAHTLTGPWLERAGPDRFLLRIGESALGAIVAYVPLILTKPGMLADDTKQYLYLDPGRLLRSAVSMWDPSVAGGTVTHQNIGYLSPRGPSTGCSLSSGRGADVGGTTPLVGDVAVRGRSRRLPSRENPRGRRPRRDRGKAGLRAEPVFPSVHPTDLGHLAAMGKSRLLVALRPPVAVRTGSARLHVRVVGGPCAATERHRSRCSALPCCWARERAQSGRGSPVSGLAPHLRWCRKTTRARRDRAGLQKGMPFQISTRPSRGPRWPPVMSARPAGEHAVAARPADDPVPIAFHQNSLARHRRGMHHNVDPGRGPARCHLVGVQLRTACLRVLEVSPGEHRHPPEPSVSC
jgi:hypothetical protein